eukprot:gene13354-28793_t
MRTAETHAWISVDSAGFPRVGFAPPRDHPPSVPQPVAAAAWDTTTMTLSAAGATARAAGRR